MAYLFILSFQCVIYFNITDRGFIHDTNQVEGMEVGLTLGMKNENGALKTFIAECGCYITDLDITMDGGSSWFYQMYELLTKLIA